MRPSHRSKWFAHRRPKTAALVAAIAFALSSHALAQQFYNIGPKTLYGPLPPAVQSDVPLAIRDAIQSMVTGTRLIAVGPRIIGGMPAPVGVYPWIASIQVRQAPGSAGHFCGGAFIAPQWVITAAHCVYKDAANKIQVVGQSNTLDQGGTVYFVDRIVTHEKWDSDTQDFDVSLLHLEKKFPGRTIPMITPADADRLAAPGTLGIAAGWGLTAEGAQVSNILRHVTVQLVSNQDCNGLASYSGAITDQMICAGFAEGGKDSCQGDSGGPLVVPDMKGGYVQAGIVSFGEGCGRPNKYGVYARVSAIQPWVASKTGATAGLIASAQSPSIPRAIRASAAPARRTRHLQSAPRSFVPDGWGWRASASR